MHRPMAKNDTTEKKESLSPLVRYTIVLAALLVTVISSGAIWNSAQPDKTLDSSDRALIRTEVIDIVRQELGESWQRGLSTVQGITINETQDGYIVQVRFSISDSNEGNLIQASAQEDVQRIMKALYQSQVPIASVQMTGTFPVADPYGFVRETEVLECGLGSSTAERLDWNSIQGDGLFNQLDSLWWHPSVGIY